MPRYSAIALFLLAAGTAHAADKTFDRTFTVSPGGSLIVNADGASVSVSSADANKVTVHMRVRSSESDLADMTLDATQSGNEVTATMRRPNSGKWFNWGSWRAESSIEVTVPKRFEVSVRTGGGSIDLKDTVGSVKLNTSGGDITAKNLNGTVWLRTSGGQITAENVQGDVEAHTSGGDVRLLSIDGNIQGHTSGGNVRVSLKGANRGIRATTSGGDVELILPRSTTGNISASTSGGHVTTDIPVTTTVIKASRLEGTFNGGGQPIEARTSGGNIRLRPEN
ncbi:MAG TPA: DUF4097 family beta strand repeat-containing protein [Steroidobacteraceae bacterium]|nr:DUF4097 family beta strand repeat-containing protein [Steroidobacteraceae bacterium]